MKELGDRAEAAEAAGFDAAASTLRERRVRAKREAMRVAWAQTHEREGDMAAALGERDEEEASDLRADYERERRRERVERARDAAEEVGLSGAAAHYREVLGDLGGDSEA